MKIVQQYHEIACPLFQEIKKTTFETKLVENLRDWFLPMLMNAQATAE